jgi:hypothetical protein
MDLARLRIETPRHQGDEFGLARHMPIERRRLHPEAARQSPHAEGIEPVGLQQGERLFDYPVAIELHAAVLGGFARD